MNLDDLKSRWNELDSQADAYKGAPDKERMAVSNRILTLRSRYIRYTYCMLAVILLATVLYIPFISENVWIFVYALVFFIMMAVFQIGLLRSVRRIDPGSMSVRETIDAVMRIERTRQIKRVAGIVSVIPLVCLITMTFIPRMGPEVAIWIAGGVIIGLVIGVIVNRYAARLLKDMRTRLDDGGVPD